MGEASAEELTSINDKYSDLLEQLSAIEKMSPPAPAFAPQPVTAAAWSNDKDLRPAVSMNEMFNQTNRMSAEDPNGVDFSNGHRNHDNHHASLKMADAQMHCPQCQEIAHKGSPSDSQYACQCGWKSGKPMHSMSEGERADEVQAQEKQKGFRPHRGSKTAADLVADAIAEPVNDGGVVASLKSRQADERHEKDLNKKRSSVAEEFGDIFAEVVPKRAAVEVLWEAELETHRFTFQGYGATRQEALRALKSALVVHEQQYGGRIEKDWWKEYTGRNFENVEYKEIRTGVGYRDNEPLPMPKSGSYRIRRKQADQDIAPDVAEAKAAISGPSKKDLANTPEATNTTDARDLEKQKSSPDHGGVPRLSSKKNADYDVQPDITSAREKLDHGAKSQLADNPDATKTTDASKFAASKPLSIYCGNCKTETAHKREPRSLMGSSRYVCLNCGFLHYENAKQVSQGEFVSPEALERIKKTADQSVEPDIAKAKAAIEGQSKAELADNPDATKTTDACELEKQACALLGDEQDEAIDIGALIGDLADLGANLPDITGGTVDVPQVGEGGLNNLPAKKEG